MRENAEIVNNETDEELKNMAMAENINLSKKKRTLENELKKMIAPRDPNDSKNM